jgi:hypothetical protein
VKGSLYRLYSEAVTIAHTGKTGFNFCFAIVHLIHHVPSSGNIGRPRVIFVFLKIYGGRFKKNVEGQIYRELIKIACVQRGENLKIRKKMTIDKRITTIKADKKH